MGRRDPGESSCAVVEQVVCHTPAGVTGGRQAADPARAEIRVEVPVLNAENSLVRMISGRLDAASLTGTRRSGEPNWTRTRRMRHVPLR
jgi:hypothetical protein